MITCDLPLPPLWPSATSEAYRSGVSKDSELIRNILDKTELDGSSIFWGQRHSIANEIRALRKGYSSPGWDGYDALPVEELSMATSLRFARLLPDGIIAPELAPEADGGIVLDWCKGKNMIFSISIKKDLVVYAGIFGESEKVRGEVRLESDRCPQIIEAMLARYFFS